MTWSTEGWRIPWTRGLLHPTLQSCLIAFTAPVGLWSIREFGSLRRITRLRAGGEGRTPG